MLQRPSLVGSVTHLRLARAVCSGGDLRKGWTTVSDSRSMWVRVDTASYPGYKHTVRQLQTQSDSYKHSKTATNTVKWLQTQSDSRSMWVRVDTASYPGYKHTVRQLQTQSDSYKHSQTATLCGWGWTQHRILATNTTNCTMITTHSPFRYNMLYPIVCGNDNFYHA